jgi:putative PIN family toxin of toxin-antitoxin system
MSSCRRSSGGGVPRELLDAAGDQRIELFTTRALIVELEDVLSRGKFAQQLNQTRFTPAYLLARYNQLATLITPVALASTGLRDPDDEAVIACAIGAAADLIVSGDKDLLVLKAYRGVRIVSAAEALHMIARP